jgi:predicted O-linked N-acetylglucosamine transferase (SPINDLY family)
LARNLARNPDRLNLLKATLQRNRQTAPLFDTAGFTQDLEAAFSAMWQRQQAGLPPGSFFVRR